MSSIRFNFDGFSNLQKCFQQFPKTVVKVGLFGNKSARTEAAEKTGNGGPRARTKEPSEMTNAEVGALQEFGSVSRRIPARPWLEMPIRVKANDIMAAAAIGADKILAAGKTEMIFKRIGAAAEAAIQNAFVTKGFGSWKDNAPYTIEKKGSSMPLIDTSQLQRAVTSKVENA